MNRKIIAAAAVAGVCALCILLCAFTFDMQSSVKSLTKPYINTYYCTEARLGDTDLLENYDYFIITILDDEELEVAFKKNDGQRHSYKCKYEFDESTRELSAELGILGFVYRQRMLVEDGSFTISMPILTKTLFMKFEVK